MPRPKEPLIRPAEAVATALAVIDRDGLDGFNIRRLAQELGVNPSSLYHHFHDKNEILNRVCRLVLDEARVVAPLRTVASWQEYVKKSVARFRRALMSHPNVAPLMTPDGPLDSFSDSIIHRGLVILAEQGVPDEYAHAIVGSINALAFGSAMLNPHGDGDGSEAGEVARPGARSSDRLFEMQIDALLKGWTVTIEEARAGRRPKSASRKLPSGKVK